MNLALIEKLALVIAKQASKKGGPVAAKLLSALFELGLTTMDIWTADDLNGEEKKSLYESSHRSVREIVEVAEAEGVEFAGEIPTLLLESAPSVIFG